MTMTAYETLVEAAARITEVDARAAHKASETADAHVRSRLSQEELESVRRLLGTSCVVPLRYELSFFEDHSDHLHHLKNLAFALTSEAKLAMSENNFRGAAQIAMDTIELANAIRRGGLVSDFLLGDAISDCAIDYLRKIRVQVDNVTCRQIIDELHRLESQREAFDVIAKRDRDWEVAVGYESDPSEIMSLELQDPEECGLTEQEQIEFRNHLQQMAELPDAYKVKMYKDLDNRSLALMRLLAIDLAVRDYHAELGEFPNELSLLAPKPFATVPIDPFTEKSFIYRCKEHTSFVLYSPGPKLTDSGGQFGAWPMVAFAGADFCLDAEDYREPCEIEPQYKGFIQRISSKVRHWWRNRANRT